MMSGMQRSLRTIPQIVALAVLVGTVVGCGQTTFFRKGSQERDSAEGEGYEKIDTREYDFSKVGDSDVFLRAFLPTRENEWVDASDIGIEEEVLRDPVYQVHFVVKRPGRWGLWNRLQYKIEGERKTKKLIRQDRSQDCSGESICEYKEVVSARLSKAEVKKLAGAEQTSLLLMGQKGDITNFTITGDEVDHFLEKVQGSEKRVISLGKPALVKDAVSMWSGSLIKFATLMS